MNTRESFRKKIKGLIPRDLLIQRLNPDAPNCVLLTFDDGPDPHITPAVLEKLETYRARAIFFLAGRCIEKAPHLLKLIQEQGHLIGNHTYIHSNGRQPWFLEYWRDVIHCQEIIEQYTGERPNLFRPAGGKISFTTLTVPWFMGLKTVTWSLEAEDWRCKSIEQAQEAAKQLIRKVRSGDVVQLHDDNRYVLEILDLILPAIQHSRHDLAQGIDFL
jgi:peptidoglycan/xylan/chitin deacetylase (PgdA/CDA1 family)